MEIVVEAVAVGLELVVLGFLWYQVWDFGLEVDRFLGGCKRRPVFDEMGWGRPS